ncbi:MAG: glycosyltransferase, partial [Bacteroidota bacterium]
MKVLFVELYYFPSIASTAQLLSQLCNRLAKDHQELEVSVLASDLGYSGNEANLERGFEIDSRIKVHRIKVPKADKNNLSLRLIAYLTYYLRAAWFLMWQTRKYDTVVSLSNPPFISLMSGFWGKVYGKKTIFWLMDMYPDALEAKSPGRKNSLLYKILDRLARKQYQFNQQIVSLSSCMQEALEQKGISPDKLSIVQNWADDQVYAEDQRQNQDGMF